MATPEPKTDVERELLRLIQKRDQEKLVDFLCDLEPRRRRSLNKFVRTVLSAERRRLALKHISMDLEKEQCFLLAVLGSSTPSEVATRADFVRLAWNFNPRREDACAALIRFVDELRPDWIDPFVDRLLNDEIAPWYLTFSFYSKGHCSRPKNDQFRLKLPGATYRNSFDRDQSGLEFVTQNIRILEAEIYDLFALPQFEDFSRATFEPTAWEKADEREKERVRDSSWLLILSTLCDAEKLDRDRLLIGAFGALAMARKKPIVGWLGELIEKLTDGNLSGWIERDDELGLLPLLASPNSTTVNWSLKKLGALQKAGGLSARELLGSIGPAFSQESKTTVTSAIKLLKRAIKKERYLHGEACRLVVEALVHSEPAIHREVLGFLQSYGSKGDESLMLKLLDYSDTIAPTVRPEFADWLPDIAPTIEVEKSVESDLRELESVLASSRRIEPIASVDELIERLSHFWQKTSDIVELNRILDALGRFADPPTDIQQRTGALTRLMDGTLPSEWFQPIVAYEFSSLPRTWIAPKEKTWIAKIWQCLGTNTFSKETSLFRRFVEPMRESLSARKVFEVLSTPTHQGFWIDPTTLVERVRRSEQVGGCSSTDLAIALLRMSFENREVARESVGRLKSEAGMALRYALGDESVAPTKDPQLWTAAARARDSRGSHKWIETLCHQKGPDSAEPAMYEWHSVPARKETSRWNKEYAEDIPAEIRCEASPSADGALASGVLPVALHGVLPKGKTWKLNWWGLDQVNLAWCVSLWPQNLDPILAQSAFLFSRGRNETSATFAEGLLSPLVTLVNNPSLPLTERGYLVLALSLTAAHRSVRGAGTDALIANLEYRWFEPARFGAAIATLLDCDCALINRLLECLKETAAVGPLLSARLNEVMAHSLALTCAEPPRLLNKWLEFYREQCPKPDLPEPARAWLGRLPRKGALGTTLKALLG